MYILPPPSLANGETHIFDIGIGLWFNRPPLICWNVPFIISTHLIIITGHLVNLLTTTTLCLSNHFFSQQQPEVKILQPLLLWSLRDQSDLTCTRHSCLWLPGQRNAGQYGSMDGPFSCAALHWVKADHAVTQINPTRIFVVFSHNSKSRYSTTALLFR